MCTIWNRIFHMLWLDGVYAVNDALSLSKYTTRFG
jgi:hypothetical protein